MLLIALMAPAPTVAETITYTASYDYNNLILGTDTLAGVTYATIHYGDLFNYCVPGAPSLPVDYIMFSVPYNATNFSVTTTTSSVNTNDIGLIPYPCQEPIPTDGDTIPSVTLPDSTIYDSGQFYPALSQNAWVVGDGFIYGENHIVTIAVMPISYRFYSGHDLLRKSRVVSVTLNYDLSSTTAITPIISLNINDRNEGHRLTQSMVVNPNSVFDFAPISSLTDTLSKPYLAPAINSGLPYFPYLIITTPELTHSLRRIVALKRQKGYNVRLVTVNDIMADPYAQYGDVVNVNGVPTVTFDDAAGSIRQFLKLARYYNSSKYLLLAGTAVPYRIKTKFGKQIPTDLYYGDLNANWRSDTIDKYPEYFVGRILAKTDCQINNYTDKLFRYELNPGQGDFSYLNRALYTESYDMKNESRLIGKWMKYICPDSTLIQERKGHQYPTANDIIDSINTNQYGFWATYNHGEPSCFVTYGKGYTNLRRLWAIDSIHIANNGFPPLPTDRGLNNMTNKAYPMVSYSISCTTMPYDLYNIVYEDLPMNFGESYTTGKDYGGPAYLGNTRDGYIGPSSDMAECFGKVMSLSHSKIGEAEALSKFIFEERIYGDYIPLVHNLLGDPSLEMWTDIPQYYNNIGITRTDNSVMISGINADSTIVAFYSNNGDIGTDTISTYSVTLNGISPNSTIMLYKHNHIPYIAPLALQNITLSNPQYVIANDVNAGSNIDNNRTNGDVIVPNGVKFEIEASGTVTLENGFKVEEGATFAVYPACF